MERLKGGALDTKGGALETIITRQFWTRCNFEIVFSWYVEYTASDQYRYYTLDIYVGEN